MQKQSPYFFRKAVNSQIPGMKKRFGSHQKPHSRCIKTSVLDATDNSLSPA